MGLTKKSAMHFAFLLLIFSIVHTASSSRSKDEPNNLNMLRKDGQKADIKPDFHTNCCNNSKNLFDGTKCMDEDEKSTRRVNLPCNYHYALEPHEYDDDAYNQLPNGSLHLHKVNMIIPLGSYCIGNHFDNETEETNEITLVCFDPEELETENFKFFMKGILIMISVFFLFVTLYVYWLLPELRETQDKVTICALICLTIFMFFLGMLQITTPLIHVDSYCLVLAFLVYFFSISYFAWLNSIMANLFKLSILRKWKIPERHWYFLNHCYVWFISVTLTIAVFSNHAIEPTFGVVSCWFENGREQWIFLYTPILVMLGINIVICTWIGIALRRSGEDLSPDRRKALKYKLILYLKLFILGGLTWLFEVLAYMFEDHADYAFFWNMVDVINCLHGVLIFLVLVMCRRRIKKELAGKRICCFLAPMKWAEGNDEEDYLENESDKGKYDLIIK